MKQASETEQRRYLSLADAEKYTTLSRSVLRRLVRQGKIRGHRPSGRRLVLDRTELDALIAAS